MATKKGTDSKWAAQDVLSRRDHSEAEMRQKLSRKGFSAPDIQETIDWLYEQKLLDDRAYAARYVESILRSKTVGPRWIAAKLKQRGVEQQYITEVLTQLMPPEKERELMAEASESWKRLHQKHATDKARLTRFLASRGFSEHLVREQVFN
ncbi:MAG: regulatory protein RecX [Candidatus Andersenbacteria bacterium]